MQYKKKIRRVGTSWGLSLPKAYMEEFRIDPSTTRFVFSLINENELHAQILPFGKRDINERAFIFGGNAWNIILGPIALELMQVNPNFDSLVFTASEDKITLKKYIPENL